MTSCLFLEGWSTAVSCETTYAFLGPVGLPDLHYDTIADHKAEKSSELGGDFPKTPL